MNYEIKKEVNLSFEEAVLKIREGLSKEGFGVITEINVKETMKKKLDVDFGNYIILGACKPNFAYEVLNIDKSVGLLLPCNVLIYEDEGKVFVSAVNAEELMMANENKSLGEIANKVKRSLKGVIDRI